MAKKTKEKVVIEPVKKRTSIGMSVRSRPKNKNNTFKRYRGQGRP